jgi:hypothetical protein
MYKMRKKTGSYMSFGNYNSSGGGSSNSFGGPGTYPTPRRASVRPEGNPISHQGPSDFRIPNPEVGVNVFK